MGNRSTYVGNDSFSTGIHSFSISPCRRFLEKRALLFCLLAGMLASTGFVYALESEDSLLPRVQAHAKLPTAVQPEKLSVLHDQWFGNTGVQERTANDHSFLPTPSVPTTASGRLNTLSTFEAHPVKRLAFSKIQKEKYYLHPENPVSDHKADACQATLISPATNAAITFPATFTWSTSGACNDLVILFSDTESGAIPYGMPVSGTGISISMEEWNIIQGNLNIQTTCFWTIGQAIGANQPVPLSPYRSFTVNDGNACTAGLISPAPNTTITLPAAFTWSTSGQCNNLAILFSDTESGVKWVSAMATGTGYSLTQDIWNQVQTSLGIQSTYYWTVGQAISENEATALAPYRLFTVNDADTCAATLLSPEPNAVVTFPAAFTWSTSGPCQDLAILFSDTDTGTKYMGGLVSGTSVTITADEWNKIRTDLGIQTIAYWTIVQVIGPEQVEPLAPYRPFTVGNGGECTAALISPAPDAVVSFPATFSWSTSGQCQDLAIIFADTDTGDNYVGSMVSETSITLEQNDWNEIRTELNIQSVCYWAIVQVISEEEISLLTPFRKFTVDGGECTAALISPAPDAVVSLPATFTWSTSGQCYDLAILFSDTATGENFGGYWVTENNIVLEEEDWNEIQTEIEVQSSCYWTIAQLVSEDQLLLLAPFQKVTFGCAATLISPEEGADVTFPATFSWSLSEECSNLAILFSDTESGEYWSGYRVSGTSVSITQDDWKQIKKELGIDTVAYWTIAQVSEDNEAIFLAPYRQFNVVGSTSDDPANTPKTGCSCARKALLPNTEWIGKTLADWFLMGLALAGALIWKRTG